MSAKSEKTPGRPGSVDGERQPRGRSSTRGHHVRVRPDRRHQLVAAALRLFSERPYDAVSVDDIATEAGVAHGLVSYYFGGKRGIYLASLELVHKDLNALTQPMSSDGDITAQLKGVSRRHFEYFRAHPQLMIGLLNSAPIDEQTRAIAEANQASGAHAVVQLLNLHDQQHAPELEAALRGCMGFVNALTVHWLTHDQQPGIDQVVDLVYDVVTAAAASAVGSGAVNAALAR